MTTTVERSNAGKTASEDNELQKTHALALDRNIVCVVTILVTVAVTVVSDVRNAPVGEADVVTDVYPCSEQYRSKKSAAVLWSS